MLLLVQEFEFHEIKSYVILCAVGSRSAVNLCLH